MSRGAGRWRLAEAAVVASGVLVSGCHLDEFACERGEPWGCASACERGVTGRRGCIALAEHHEKRPPEDASPELVLALYDLACEAGDAEGCKAAESRRAPRRRGRTQAGLPAPLACPRLRPIDQPMSIEGLPLAPSVASAKARCDGDVAACVELGQAIESGARGPVEPVLALSLYEKACRGGNVAGCDGAARMVSSGNGTKQDGERANQLRKDACSKGHRASCVALAVRTLSLGSQPEAGAAAAELEKACQAGEEDGCAWLATFLLEGMVVPQDKSKGEKLRKAYENRLAGRCQKRDGEACARLGDLRWLTDIPWQEWRQRRAFEKAPGKQGPNLPEAKSLLTLGCDAGDVAACAGLASLLRDGLKESDAYQALLERLSGRCEKDDEQACMSLVRHLASHPSDAADKAALAGAKACGWSIPGGCLVLSKLPKPTLAALPSAEPAEAYLRKACKLGHGKACGWLLDEPEGLSPGELAGWYAVACENGWVDSCSALALAQPRKNADPREAPCVRELYARWCDPHRSPLAYPDERTIAKGCGRLGELQLSGVGGPVDLEGARENLLRACLGTTKNPVYEEPMDPACVALGDAHAEGRLGPQDVPLAAALYALACSGQDARACGRLAPLLRSGRGVPRDEALAREVLTRGCALGDAASCGMLPGGAD